MAEDDRGSGGPPGGGRPRGGRPTGRPHGGRPSGGKPTGGRPYGDRPPGGRPPGPRPYVERSSRPRPYGDRPPGERPYDRPYGARPSGERPHGRPSGYGPPADRASGARPSDGRPYGNRSYGDRPAERRPWEDRDRAGRGQTPGDRPIDRPPPARTSEHYRQDRPAGGPPFRPRPGASRPPNPGGSIVRPTARARVAAGNRWSRPLRPPTWTAQLRWRCSPKARRSWPAAGPSRRPSQLDARPCACSSSRSGVPPSSGFVLHATTLRIPVVEVEGGTITAISGFDGHQGVALVVAPRRWATLDDVLALARSRGEPPLILVLDHLEDPQNVGTLLRSAEACGVHGVLFPSHGAAPISPAAIKTSAGAVEHLLLVPLGICPAGWSTCTRAACASSVPTAMPR